MNTSKPCILTSVGRCLGCGRVGCLSPLCFRRELDRHEAPPVIGRQAADRLVSGLVKDGWSRRLAEARVNEWFKVAA